jgi:hypothetical protein
MPRGPRRTDLLVPKPEAVTTAPDQEYGKRTSQEQSQRILPLGGPGLTAGGGGSGPSVSGPNGNPGLSAGAAQPVRLPGDRGDWRRPTERPNEPLTTGLSTGPGPGPEGLTGFAALGHAQATNANGSTAQLLKQMANSPNASDVVRTLAANT